MPGPSDPGFDTLALHAGAAPDPATGARATPIHLTTSFVFESSEHAASLFNMERAGHVYSRISQPDQRRARGTRRRARRRRRRDRHRQRPGRAAPGDRDDRRRRLAHRRQRARCTAARTTCCLHAGALRHRDHLRQARATSTPGAPRSGPNTQAAVRRDARQPRPRRARHPARRRTSRTTHGVPLLVDSTFTTPWLHAAVRARRRPGVPLGDQVPVRPRHRRSAACWSTRGRFDWERTRPLPRAERALRRLPRHGVHRGEHRRRVPAARAPRRPARLRRLHEPAHRVADPARHRDAAAAHGAPRRQHAQGGRVPGRASDGGARSAIPSSSRIPTTRSPRRCCRAAAARSSASTCAARARRASRSSRRCKLFSHLANVGDCRSLVIHPASTTHFRMDDAALAARRHRAGHDPAVDRPGGRGRPDRRPEARAEGRREGGACMKLDVARPRGLRVHRRQAVRRRRGRCVVFIHGALNDHSRLDAAGALVRAPRLRACWRSTCRATAAATGRRWPASRRSPTGCSRCSTPPACAGAHLVGHSMGSLIALEAAARAPERVAPAS